MYKNFDRLVWAILITALCVFCLLLVGIPLGVRSFLFNTRIHSDALLEAISGTVLIRNAGNPEPVAVSMQGRSTQDVPRIKNVKAGSTVTTDDTSRAILTFHRAASEESIVLSTVQLYNNTRLTIVESSSPRFQVSPHTDRILVKVEAGQVRVAVSRFERHSPLVEVRTPHSKATLQEGSYSIRVTSEGSEIVTRFGEAKVEAEGQSVATLTGQRVVIAKGEPPGAVVPAAQNLIVNGNFSDPLSPSWQTDSFQAAPDAGAGMAEIVTTSGRKAVFFSRMGKDGIHTEVGISQVINRDVLDFESLVLRLDVKLLYQSLSGGGYLSSEFPLMVRLDYKDIYGIDRFWIRGFYYQNVDAYPIQADLWGRPLGDQIPHAIWYPFESENLLTALGDIRPARIHSIRIYASGWNFQSMVSEVGLIAE